MLPDVGECAGEISGLDHEQRLVLLSYGTGCGIDLWPTFQFLVTVQGSPVNVADESCGQPN